MLRKDFEVAAHIKLLDEGSSIEVSKTISSHADFEKMLDYLAQLAAMLWPDDHAAWVKRVDAKEA